MSDIEMGLSDLPDRQIRTEVAYLSTSLMSGDWDPGMVLEETSDLLASLGHDDEEVGGHFVSSEAMLSRDTAMPGIIGLVTAGIVSKEVSKGLAPRQNVEDLMADDGLGQDKIDEIAHVKQVGDLLKIFLYGLSQEGYPLGEAKKHARNEITATLDYLGARGSYTAVDTVIYLEKVLKAARLTTPTTRAKRVVRTIRAISTYGGNIYQR
jgi:hypothetical protein